MKTYSVAFKYETWAIYDVQADGYDDAETIALAMLQNDEGDYLHSGEWTETEIEEIKEVCS
jgi:phosphoserine aminotransferase